MAERVRACVLALWSALIRCYCTLVERAYDGLCFARCLDKDVRCLCFIVLLTFIHPYGFIDEGRPWVL